MQPDESLEHASNHPVGVANLLNALASGGHIDPTTGKMLNQPVPKQLTPHVSKFHTDMAIWKMKKAGTLEAVIEIKDKAKALGLLKSHLELLRNEYEQCYRKFKPTTNQKGNEDGDQKKEKDQ